MATPLEISFLGYQTHTFLFCADDNPEDVLQTIRLAFRLPERAHMRFSEPLPVQQQPQVPPPQPRWLGLKALLAAQQAVLHSDVLPEVHIVPAAYEYEWVSDCRVHHHLPLNKLHVPEQETVRCTVQIPITISVSEEAAEKYALTLIAEPSWGLGTDIGYERHGEHWYVSVMHTYLQIQPQYPDSLTFSTFNPVNEDKTVTQQASTEHNGSVSLGLGASGPIPRGSIGSTFGFRHERSYTMTLPLYATNFAHYTSPPTPGTNIRPLRSCWGVELRRRYGKKGKVLTTEWNTEENVCLSYIDEESLLGVKKKTFSQKWILNIHPQEMRLEACCSVILRRNNHHQGHQTTRRIQQRISFAIRVENGVRVVDISVIGTNTDPMRPSDYNDQNLRGAVAERQEDIAFQLFGEQNT